MLDLVSNYSLSEILTFLVIFCLAVKGFFTFWDWAVDRLRKAFNKENQQEKKTAELQEQINQCNTNFQKISDRQQKFEETLATIIEKINLLLDSDKDDIKSYITKEHHYFCYTKKWIDDYSLDCIEKRFKHYQEEHGNSFVEDLMKELRALPKQPPEE